MNFINITLDTMFDTHFSQKIKQLDDLTLILNIFDNGIPRNLTGYVATLNCLKSDGTYVIQNNDIAINNNIITVALNKNATRVPGALKIELVLTKDFKQKTSFTFNFDVIQSVIDGAVESKDVVTIVETLLHNITKAQDENAKTENLIATGGAATKAEVNTVANNLATTNNTLSTANTNINKNTNDITLKQNKTDTALNTTQKTIVGAINQLLDGINAISAMYADDINTVRSLNTNAPFTGKVKYSKAFNVVTITLNATSSNVGNNVLLCNLPLYYRPSEEIFVPIFVVTGSNLWGYNKCGLKIAINGDVTFVTENTESTKAIYCSFSFHI